jgi:hypothetical protein
VTILDAAIGTITTGKHHPIINVVSVLGKLLTKKRKGTRRFRDFLVSRKLQLDRFKVACDVFMLKIVMFGDVVSHGVWHSEIDSHGGNIRKFLEHFIEKVSKSSLIESVGVVDSVY